MVKLGHFVEKSKGSQRKSTRQMAMDRLLNTIIKYTKSMPYLQQMLLPDGLEEAIAKKEQFLFEMMRTTGCRDYRTLPGAFQTSAYQKADIVKVSISDKYYHQIIILSFSISI